MKLKLVIKNTGTDSAILALQGELTIYTVQKLREVFLARINSLCELNLDLSKVSKIDTAGCQFLLALKHEFREGDRCLACVDSSDEVCRILDLYGATI